MDLGYQAMANRIERQLFQASIMELQVKELQKADVRACCLHDEFNREKKLIEGKYSIVHGHLKLHEVDKGKTTN